MAEPVEETRSWLGWLQVGVVVLVVLVGIYFARAPQVPEYDDTPVRGAEAPTVTVMQPTAGSQSLTVSLTGGVDARTKVRVQPGSSGQVVEVSPSLRSGGTFRAGETLLRIDPSDYQTRLDRARANVDAAQGRLRKQRDKGDYDSAQFRRSNPGQDVPPSIARLGQIQRFDGRVRALEADVKLAEERLADTTVSMPFDGTVIVASVAVGERVGPGPVATVFRTGDVEVRAPIATDDLAYLDDPRGRAATVWAGGRRFDAAVTQQSPVLAPKTRLAALFLDFAEGSADLPMPGTFALVSIRGPAFDNAFLLPDAAHRTDDSVWIVQDGKLERVVPRTLGRTDEGWVVAAFDAGEGVVVGAVPDEQPGLAVAAVAAGDR